MARSRGFTLLELLIAGTIAAIVALGGFLAMAHVQDAAADQRRISELVSEARLALELIGRDVRSAGDSLEMLPAHCLGGLEAAGTPYLCAAVLDPHPWRLTLARNTWEPGEDGVLSTMDDRAPQLAFELNPANVVTYQFVPDGGVRSFGSGEHQGVVGRLERVVNPFQFANAPREVTVLLDRIVLDNRMRVNPADPTQSDARYDYSLFMYQLLSVASGEYAGDEAYTKRTTRHTSFLLPPVRFFDPLGDYETYQDSTPARPWLPDYDGPKIVGLKGPTDQLLAAGTSFDEDLRYVLDYNRIRTVRVAFMVVDTREDPELHDGIDLDPDHPGTARVFPFETTVELKVFSAMLN